MRILVTNDDGIDSVGLHVLARTIAHHGDVVVVAPDTEYSGASAAVGALHLIHPEVRRVALDGVSEAWAVTGPPALCVMFARLGAFGPPFDFVVSGINPGANVGRSVYHSGTVGAALTARTGGLNAIAVSQAVTGFGVEGQGWDEMLAAQQWDTAAAYADAALGALIASPPAEAVVVNLNVPNVAVHEVRGVRRTTVATMAHRAMTAAVLEPKLGHDGAFLVKMAWGDAVELPPETDSGAVARGEVSITLLSRISEVADDTVLGMLDRVLRSVTV